eukprot:1482146-Prymnesium_polylepis.1
MAMEWVQRTFGSGVHIDPNLVALGSESGEQFDSVLLGRGPGAEPGPFDPEQFSAGRFFVNETDGTVTWGQAPTERPPGEELALRLSDGQIVWTAARDGQAPELALCVE